MKKKLLDEFIDKSYYFLPRQKVWYFEKMKDIVLLWSAYKSESWLTCRSTIANGTLNQEGQQKKQRCWRDPHSFFYSSRKQFTVTHKSNSKKKKKEQRLPFRFRNFAFKSMIEFLCTCPQNPSSEGWNGKSRITWTTAEVKDKNEKTIHTGRGIKTKIGSRIVLHLWMKQGCRALGLLRSERKAGKSLPSTCYRDSVLSISGWRYQHRTLPGLEENSYKLHLRHR